MTSPATAAHAKMAALIAGRTTDQLIADLAHLGTLPSTQETRLVGAAIADHITAREAIDPFIDDVFQDPDFAGTYLDAILLAIAAKAAR